MIFCIILLLSIKKKKRSTYPLYEGQSNENLKCAAWIRKINFFPEKYRSMLEHSYVGHITETMENHDRLFWYPFAKKKKKSFHLTHPRVFSKYGEYVFFQSEAEEHVYNKNGGKNQHGTWDLFWWEWSVPGWLHPHPQWQHEGSLNGLTSIKITIYTLWEILDGNIH